MAIIEIQHLTKKFKNLVAVDDVNLGIEEGECFGLLGPNGAGKTSLVRMITAVSPPTKGNIWVLAKDLATHAREIKAVLGVVPQVDNLDEDLTVFQNLTTFARYFDILKGEAYRRSLELLSLFKLEDKSRSQIKELSGGMRRRLLVARGLINQPKILILDEPTIGLDPEGKHLVWRKLDEFRAQGITQLLCTQNMEEAAALCNRVAIMHQGKILTQGSPQALVSRYVGDEVLEIKANSKDRGKIVEELTNLGLEFVDVADAIQVFRTSRDELAKGLVNSVESLRQRPATLEDVFFKFTGRALGE